MNKKKLVVAAYLAVCALIVVVGVARVITSPSEGTVQPVKAAVQPTVKPVPVDTAYAAFNYPDNFTPRATPAPVKPVVASYRFVKQNNPWSIDISITRLSGGSLSDDASYNLRQRMPARFTASSQRIGSQDVQLFTDTQADGYSKTAYIHNQTYDASITISGVTAGDAESSMNDRFQLIVSSWQWK